MILCSCRLVQEKYIGSEPPVTDFTKHFFSFRILRTEDKTSGPLIRGRTANITLLRNFVENISIY